MGHTAAVDAVAWSADSSRLVTGSADGTAKVWQIADGQARDLYSLSSLDTVDGVAGVALSADGNRVLTGDQRVGAATVWDVGLGGEAEVRNVPSAPRAGRSVAFMPDRGHVVAGRNAAATIFDVETGAHVRSFDPGGAAERIAVSHDGAWVGAPLDDGSLRVGRSDRRAGVGIRAGGGGPRHRHGSSSTT